jgi:transposase-like protein
MRYSANFIRRHLADQSTSGLSVATYCAQHHLSVPTFYYWRRKHRQSPIAPPTQELALDRFTQLQPLDVLPTVSLTTPGGSKLDLSELSIDELTCLVRKLESADA